MSHSNPPKGTDNTELRSNRKPKFKALHRGDPLLSLISPSTDNYQNNLILTEDDITILEQLLIRIPELPTATLYPESYIATIQRRQEILAKLKGAKVIL